MHVACCTNSHVTQFGETGLLQLAPIMDALLFLNLCFVQEYIRREVKPTTKQQLVQGIQQFWATVDIVKCRKYIGHLRKVLPRMNGHATGN